MDRKYKATVTLQDAYKLYRKDGGKLLKKDFLKIAYDIDKAIANMIITESLEYRIPEKLGFLRIKKKQQKLIIKNNKIDLNSNVIDWGKTWDYWNKQYPGLSRKEIKKKEGKKVIFQTNTHTDGDIMRWYWEKRGGVNNINVYSFNTVKGGVQEDIYLGRLGLAQWIKSGKRKNDYYY